MSDKYGYCQAIYCGGWDYYFKHSPLIKISAIENSQTVYEIKKLSPANGFVEILANCSCNLQCCNTISSLLINSIIKWYLSSICLVLLWKTKLFDNAIAEVLSQKIIVAPSWSWQRSLNILLIQTTWHVVVVAATYSTFTVDNDIVGCFLEAHEISLEPKWKTYPNVLFLSSTLPAQSLSM